MRTAVTPDTFANLYAQGFVRVGVASHRVVPGDPTANMAEVLSLIRQAEREHVGLLLFPELGITGYAIDDLQQQAVIQNEAEGAIAALCEATRDLQVIALIGAPLRWRQRLYNCAIAIQAGRVLGVIPKSYLPNYREFYEARQFADAASVGPDSEIGVAGQNVPFGTNLIFEALNLILQCVWKFVKMCGCRSRHRHGWLWGERLFWQTYPRPHQQSAKQTIAMTCAACNRHSVLLPICIQRQGMENLPRILPGMARR